MNEAEDQQTREWAKVAYDQMVFGTGYYRMLPDGRIEHVPVEDATRSVKRSGEK